MTNLLANVVYWQLYNALDLEDVAQGALWFITRHIHECRVGNWLECFTLAIRVRKYARGVVTAPSTCVYE
jgi:hypothetical protein